MASPRGLPMAAVPVLVVALLLQRRHLLEGLLFGILAGLLLGLGLGLLRPADLLSVEPGSFAARSVVIDGLSRSVGVSIFTLLLVGLVAALEATPTLERAAALGRTRVRGPRGAEAWIVGAVSGAVLLTTHSVVAMLAVGDFAREVGERAGLSAYRRANLLDLTVCTWPFLLPYFLPTILMAAATAPSGVLGHSAPPRLSPLGVGLANAYSWALAAMVAIAVTSGYGRGERAPDSSNAASHSSR